VRPVDEGRLRTFRTISCTGAGVEAGADKTQSDASQDRAEHRSTSLAS
jgi:hypothetical protein